MRLLQRVSDFIEQPLREANRQQREFLASRDGQKFDLETSVVLVSAAVLLSLRWYLFPARLPAWLEDMPMESNRQLASLLFWGAGQFLCYVAAPAALVKFVLRKRLANYGVKRRGSLASWPIYLAMYLGLLPLLLLASRRESFLETYPFYRLADGESLWPRFWIWQVCYAIQFVSLEFFFRGFMLLGCVKRFGAYSILVMTIPYCMLHFGKPLLETLASIVAGLLLGFMCLKTRSIWLGAALHIAVALTMDFAAIATPSDPFSATRGASITPEVRVVRAGFSVILPGSVRVAVVPTRPRPSGASTGADTCAEVLSAE